MPHDTPGETSQVATSDRGCVGVSTPAERQIGRNRTFCACAQCRTVLLKLGLLGADKGADTVSGHLERIEANGLAAPVPETLMASSARHRARTYVRWSPHRIQDPAAMAKW